MARRSGQEHAMSLPAHSSFFGLALEFPGESGNTARVGSSIDPHELEVALRLLEPGDRALVAGGGLGAVSLLLAARLGAQNIVTYEANPFLANLALNNISWEDRRLDFRHGALSTHNGVCDFYIASNWALSSIRGNMVGLGLRLGTVEVPSVNINDVLIREKLTALVLDIEGGEHDILPELRFDLLRVLVVELHGHKKDLQALQAHIARNMTIQIDMVKDENFKVIGATR